MLESTLKKVASDVNVGDIWSGRKRLTEEDINVEDCSLTQNERLTLYTRCRDFFDEEAWTAVGHNTKDISNTALRTSSSLCTQKRKTRTSGYFIALARNFPT